MWVLEFELRLVIQLQMPPFNRLAQALEALLLIVLGDAHGWIETGNAIAASVLGLIHGEVGIDDQLVRRR
ncbi:hypothetical protein D3C77_422700 [compost metagenome]